MIQTDTIVDFFMETRERTEAICAPLETEDYVVQPIADVSPPKWHLGHTTWFFEEFILKVFKKEYSIFDDDFSFVFNSYYESVGKRVIRTNRGNLSRPSVEKFMRTGNMLPMQCKSYLAQTTMKNYFKFLKLVFIMKNNIKNYC